MRPGLLRACGVAWLAAFPVAFAGQALAQEPGEAALNEATLNKVVELNKKALALYDALDMAAAASLLDQALAICKSAKLENHPTAARTHIHLGVVHISGLKHPELGLAEFRAALAIDPKIRITKSLVNPEVQAAFEKAQSPEPAGAPPTIAPSSPPPPEAASPTTTTTPLPPIAPEPPAVPSIPIIIHPLVTQAIQGHGIEIKAQVPPGAGVAKVRLAYLSQNIEDFLARDMTPIENMPGWFHARVPEEVTHGTWVSYYIEAQDSDDRVMTQHGNPANPHTIVLLPETESAELASTDKPRPAAKRGLWLVAAVGSGGGYHSGTPEMNPRDNSSPPASIHVSGLGASTLLHVAPEIGFFSNEHLIFSAQGRFQYVTGAQNVQLDGKTYSPPAVALAGLAKATWLWGSFPQRTQPFVSVQAGAGQIRHAVTTPSSAPLTGCAATPSTCNDTVLGGLGLAGIGAGVIYRRIESVGLYGAINVLAGFPHAMVNADLNLGLVFER